MKIERISTQNISFLKKITKQNNEPDLDTVESQMGLLKQPDKDMFIKQNPVDTKKES